MRVLQGTGTNSKSTAAPVCNMKSSLACNQYLGFLSVGHTAASLCVSHHVITDLHPAQPVSMLMPHRDELRSHKLRDRGKHSLQMQR